MLFAVFVVGCSPKALFPTDNRVYDSTLNYNYNFEKHTFFSSNKTLLHALYIQTAKKSKGIVVVTNGLHENMSNRFTKWLWIVDSGYDVFIFDYRGYGESDAEVDMYGFRDDVNAAIEYAHSLDTSKSMILAGQSMGGTFVIDALVKKEYDYIDLVVVDSTFTGFASTLSSFMLKSFVLIPFAWLPYTFSPDDLNAIENIGELNTPVLFVTGDDDWIVDYKNSHKLYDKAKVEKSLWIVEGVGHVESFENLALRESFLELLKNREFFRSTIIKHF